MLIIIVITEECNLLIYILGSVNTVLKSGEVYPTSAQPAITTGPLFIQGDKEFTVGQYSLTQDGYDKGAPTFTLVPSVDQYTNLYTFTLPSSGSANYIG